MNTGLLLEVIIVSFVLLQLLYLFTLHNTSLTTLLLNEKETRRIIHALVISDRYISSELSLDRMGIKTNNLVDCSLLKPEGNLYLRCGSLSYGEMEGKLVVRRLVVDVNKPSVFEVGVP